MTLRSDAQRYIAFKRGQGYKMDSEERLLRRYVSHAEVHGDTFSVAARMVEWAGTAPSPSTVRIRLSALRCFARWVRAEDERHEVPPNNVGPGEKIRPAPHLLAPADIRRLIDAALSLEPAGSITPQTYHFLFGLMAVTGLRRSEAVRLRLGDITPDGLVVSETKFRKSRLLPLHDSTWRALERYLQLRARMGSSDDHLFVLANGKPPRPDNATKTFTDLACQLGLRQGPGKGGGVRLHDLRHCFAVRALERAGAADRDGVNRHMLALSTYLGHGDISSTYWYLEATPVLMRQVALAAEEGYDGRSAT